MDEPEAGPSSHTLSTERLLLRPVRDDDVDRILEYRNLPEVKRWLLRTEVDPDSFRAAWMRAAEDPDDHGRDNVRSWRLLERVGMRREQHGIADSWHAELGWVDGYTYAVLAEEWLRAR